MGPSSSGKDSIYQRILTENHFALQKMIMYTTRPKRIHEKQGREYYFCTEEEMIQLAQEKKIIEARKYDTVYGPWYYFTTMENIHLETQNYLGMNTLVGLDNYLKYYDPKNIISILIQTEDSIRLTRALERENGQENPKYDEMCRRFLADSVDFSKENIQKRKITAIIDNNGTLEESMEQVNKVLRLHL